MKEMKEMTGVTFNGSVTFNGPMFDIHDNEQVTIVNDKNIEPDCEGDGDDDRLPLPKVLDTDRAQKYFHKAIERGYMRLENGKVVWVGICKNGLYSQLAYFCGKVYGYRHSINGNIGNAIPEEELTAYFGVKKILVLINQVYNASKKQPWRVLIDELFSE